MAGGVKDGIWAIVGEIQWTWMFGEPLHKASDLVYIKMQARVDRDEFECWTGTHRLVVTGLDIARAGDGTSPRVRSLPADDNPFVGFDNLPEPEFGTGWDDLDWSR